MTDLLVIIPIAFAIRTFVFGLYQVPTGSMEPTLLVGERFFADKLTYWFRAPKKGEIIAFNSPDKSVSSLGFNYSKNPFMNWFQNYVYGPSNWTKRLIAGPGDHIVGKIEDGNPVIYLNDTKLDQPFVNKYPLIRVWNDMSPTKMAARYHDGYQYSTKGWYGSTELPIMSENSTLRTFDPDKPFGSSQPFYAIDASRIILNAAGKPYQIILSGTPRKEDIFDVTLKDNQFWVMGDNRLNSGDSRAFGILSGKLIHGRIVFRIWSMDSEESWWFIDLFKHPMSFWSKIRWNRCFQFVS